MSCPSRTHEFDQRAALLDSFDEIHPAFREARLLFVAENGPDLPVLTASNHARTVFRTYADWSPGQLQSLSAWWKPCS